MKGWDNFKKVSNLQILKVGIRLPSIIIFIIYNLLLDGYSVKTETISILLTVFPLGTVFGLKKVFSKYLFNALIVRLLFNSRTISSANFSPEAEHDFLQKCDCPPS